MPIQGFLEGVAAPSSSLAGALVWKNPGGARGKTLIFFFFIGNCLCSLFHEVSYAAASSL